MVVWKNASGFSSSAFASRKWSWRASSSYVPMSRSIVSSSPREAGSKKMETFSSPLSLNRSSCLYLTSRMHILPAVVIRSISASMMPSCRSGSRNRKSASGRLTVTISSFSSSSSSISCISSLGTSNFSG